MFTPTAVLAAGLAEPLMGRLADRIGARWALGLGLAGFSVFSVLTASTSNAVVMVGVRGMLGVFQGLFIAASLAVVGARFERWRGLALAALVGTFSLGSALNPPLTRAIFSEAGGAWQMPALVYGICGLALAAALFALSGRDTLRVHLRTPTLAVSRTRFRPGKRWLVLMMLCWGVAEYVYLGSYITYLRQAQNFALDSATLVVSIAGWLGLAATLVIGWASDRVGRSRMLLVAACCATTVAYPLFTISHTFWLAVLLATIFQATNGSVLVLCVASAQDGARQGRLGARSGLIVGSGHIMSVVGGGVGWAWAMQFGYPGLAGLVTVLCGLMTAFLGLGVVFARRGPKPNAQPALAAGRPGAYVGALGAIVVLVAFMLPWASCQSVTITGAQLASGQPDGFGNSLLWLVPAAAAGLIVVAIGRYRLRLPRLERLAAIAQVLLGAFGAILGALAIVGIFNARSDPRLPDVGQYVQVEPGAWLTAVGFVVAAVGGVLRRRKSHPDPSSAPEAMAAPPVAGGTKM